VGKVFRIRRVVNGRNEEVDKGQLL